MVDSPYQLVIAGFLNHQQCLNVSSGFGDVWGENFKGQNISVAGGI